jgi:hypothetical protein
VNRQWNHWNAEALENNGGVQTLSANPKDAVHKLQWVSDFLAAISEIFCRGRSGFAAPDRPAAMVESINRSI